MIFQFNSEQSPTKAKVTSPSQPFWCSVALFPIKVLIYSYVFIFRSLICSQLYKACSSLDWNVLLWNLCKLASFWKIEELLVIRVVICTHLCRKQLLDRFHQVTASESFSIKKGSALSFPGQCLIYFIQRKITQPNHETTFLFIFPPVHKYHCQCQQEWPWHWEQWVAQIIGVAMQIQVQYYF